MPACLFSSALAASCQVRPLAALCMYGMISRHWSKTLVTPGSVHGTWCFISLMYIKLMKHQVPWTDPGVTKVFDQWREIMPYMQSAANGRTWQDAAKALENKQAGMMFQGSNQVAANYDPKNLDDLDFFVFPSIDPQWGTDFMDAPTDGFILPKKGKNQAAAKKVLEY